MENYYNVYHCFISSPSDVQTERDMVEQTIYKVNQSIVEPFKVALNVKKWELMPPETTHIPEETLQDKLNKEVEKSNFFVLILYGRYGTIDNGQRKSNTEREVDTILERYKKKPDIKILSYFRDIEKNPNPCSQEQRIKELRTRLHQIGLFYKTYTTPEEFKEVFIHDIYNTILKMKFSSYKQYCLNNFWNIPATDMVDIPRMEILYPPVTRFYSDPEKDKHFWLKRLEPNIYFEDYKCIHKLRKTFSIIGFHDYCVCTSFNPHPYLCSMSRVWICVPRFDLALKYLKKHEKKIRFSLTPRKANQPGKIIWKTQSGEKIEINSPLSKYMLYQRKKLYLKDEWYPELGKIVGKDYAVLARLKDEESSSQREGGFLRDYVFAGIRGLGTWGAGWFIDRRSRHFSNTDPEDDIQLLLEVQYRDGVIFDVRDVSEFDTAYFKEQNNPKTIRKNIEEMRAISHISFQPK